MPLYHICVEPVTNGNAILVDGMEYIDIFNITRVIYPSSTVCGLHSYEDHHRRHIPNYKLANVVFR